MAEQTVAVPEAQKPPRTERTRHHERYIAPPFDIYETREGLGGMPATGSRVRSPIGNTTW